MAEIDLAGRFVQPSLPSPLAASVCPNEFSQAFLEPLTSVAGAKRVRLSIHKGLGRAFALVHHTTDLADRGALFSNAGADTPGGCGGGSSLTSAGNADSDGGSAKSSKPGTGGGSESAGQDSLQSSETESVRLSRKEFRGEAPAFGMTRLCIRFNPRSRVPVRFGVER